MEEFNLIATAAFGLEAVLARELEWLGVMDHKTDNGRIYYKGDAAILAKSLLWLRTADRVLLNMGSFKALTFEDLFQGVKAIKWENLMPENATFIVNARSQKSQLFSLRDIQAISKKAIAERLKTAYHKEWIDETGPRFQIEIVFMNDVATITVDASGHGLHKRGYRMEVGEAPIKETLAAAMILVSRWKRDRAFLDPFCGSGTLGIEAAMIAKNVAPGLRAEFDCERWSDVISGVMREERKQAENAVKSGDDIKIFCSDIDYKQLKLAEKHAELAGVSDVIHFQKLDFKETGSRYKYGFIITNPPYGERLLEKQEAEKIYRDMGEHFKKFDTWSVYVITCDENFEKLYGKKADKKRKLYNGALKCDYYQFFGPKPPKAQTDESVKQTEN